MEILLDLTGSLFWATALSLIFYASTSASVGFLAKKSAQLKPIGSGPQPHHPVHRCAAFSASGRG
jgi:hypothetical protein